MSKKRTLSGATKKPVEKMELELEPSQEAPTGEDTRKFPSLEEMRMTRRANEEQLKDLRQNAEHQKLMYEINHYKLQSMKDFIEAEEIREKYLATQDAMIARIEAARAELAKGEELSDLPPLDKPETPIDQEDRAIGMANEAATESKITSFTTQNADGGESIIPEKINLVD